MKNFWKKSLSLLLVTLMLFATIPTGIFAVTAEPYKVGSTTYADLEAAVDAVKPGGTYYGTENKIYVTENATFSGSVDSNFAIPAGITLQVADGVTFTLTGGLKLAGNSDYNYYLPSTVYNFAKIELGTGASLVGINNLQVYRFYVTSESDNPEIPDGALIQTAYYQPYLTVSTVAEHLRTSRDKEYYFSKTQGENQPRYTPAATDPAFSGELLFVSNCPANFGITYVTSGNAITVEGLSDSYTFKSMVKTLFGATVDNSANATTFTTAGADVVLVAPAPVAGFTFVGWYYGDQKVAKISGGYLYDENGDEIYDKPIYDDAFDGVNTLYDSATGITAPVTLVAHWSWNTIEITYVTDGSAVTTPQTVHYNEVFELPVTSKEGYDFATWTDGTENYAPGSYAFLVDTTLTATWGIHQITVQYQAVPAGAVTVVVPAYYGAATVLDYGAALPHTDPAFVNPGSYYVVVEGAVPGFTRYDFDGWDYAGTTVPEVAEVGGVRLFTINATYVSATPNVIGAVKTAAGEWSVYEDETEFVAAIAVAGADATIYFIASTSQPITVNASATLVVTTSDAIESDITVTAGTTKIAAGTFTGVLTEAGGEFEITGGKYTDNVGNVTAGKNYVADGYDAYVTVVGGTTYYVVDELMTVTVTVDDLSSNGAAFDAAKTAAEDALKAYFGEASLTFKRVKGDTFATVAALETLLNTTVAAGVGVEAYVVAIPTGLDANNVIEGAVTVTVGYTEKVYKLQFVTGIDENGNDIYLMDGSEIFTIEYKVNGADIDFAAYDILQKDAYGFAYAGIYKSRPFYSSNRVTGYTPALPRMGGDTEVYYVAPPAASLTATFQNIPSTGNVEIDIYYGKTPADSMTLTSLGIDYNYKLTVKNTTSGLVLFDDVIEKDYLLAGNGTGDTLDWVTIFAQGTAEYEVVFKFQYKPDAPVLSGAYGNVVPLGTAEDASVYTDIADNGTLVWNQARDTQIRYLKFAVSGAYASDKAKVAIKVTAPDGTVAVDTVISINQSTLVFDAGVAYVTVMLGYTPSLFGDYVAEAFTYIGDPSQHSDTVSYTITVDGSYYVVVDWDPFLEDADTAPGFRFPLIDGTLYEGVGTPMAATNYKRFKAMDTTTATIGGNKYYCFTNTCSYYPVTIEEDVDVSFNTSVTVTATFTYGAYNKVVSNVANGDVYYARSGSTYEISAVNNFTGYNIVGWTVYNWNGAMNTSVPGDTVIGPMGTLNAKVVLSCQYNEKYPLSVDVGRGEVTLSWNATVLPCEDMLINYQIPYGTVLTMVAEPATGYTFVGWINSNSGALVSTNATVEYTIGALNSFKALYVKDTSNYVVFTDLNKTIVFAGNYVAGAMNVPADLSDIGPLAFAGWTVDGQTALTAADFNAMTGCQIVDAMYTSTVNYTITKDIDGAVTTESVPYASYYTATAPAIDGKTFSAWKVNGVYVSTNTTYKFRVMGDTTVVAVYDVAVTITPQALATKMGKSVTFSTVLPDGYEVVSMTICMAATGVMGASDLETLLANPNVKNTTVSNASLTVTVQDTTVVAYGGSVELKAYVTYRDDEGNLHTLVTDVVTVTTAD